MRKNYLFLVAVLLIVAAGRTQEFSNPLHYQVKIIHLQSLVNCSSDKVPAGENAQPFWEHILITDRDYFIYNLTNKAGDDDKPVYNESNVLYTSSQQVKNQYCYLDTLSFQPINSNVPKDTVFIRCADLLHHIQSIDFIETWSYNKSGKFSKEVNTYGPLLTLHDENTGKEIGEKILFYQKGGWDDFSTSSITQLIRYRVFIADPNSADLGNELIQSDEKMEWLNNLVELIQDGKLEAYDPFNINDQLTGNELQDRIEIRDSAKVTRSKAPHDQYDTVFVTSKLKNVCAIDFFEEWSFDKDGNIEKEVLAYQPVMVMHDPMTLDVRGYLALFFVYNSEKAEKKLVGMNFPRNFY